jgi:hypothetical protein
MSSINFSFFYSSFKSDLKRAWMGTGGTVERGQCDAGRGRIERASKGEGPKFVVENLSLLIFGSSEKKTCLFSAATEVFFDGLFLPTYLFVIRN